MSILSTIFRGEKYIKQSNGYEKMSEWQLAKDVEYDDGKNGQTKHGAIDGITSDVNGTSDNIAASIKVVNGINNKVPFKFGIDADGNYGYYKAGADTVTPFKTGDINFAYKVLAVLRADMYNYFIFDVSEMTDILINQQANGGSNTVIYGYSTLEDARNNTNGTTLKTITSSDVTSKYASFYIGNTSAKASKFIDVTKYNFIKIVEGYNWGTSYISSTNNKFFKYIEMQSKTGFAEMCLRRHKLKDETIKGEVIDIAENQKIAVETRSIPAVSAGYSTFIGTADDYFTSSRITNYLPRADISEYNEEYIHFRNNANGGGSYTLGITPL